MKKLFVQFIKFGFVGALNTAITLSVYYVFIGINPGLYLIGNAMGFLIGGLNSYLLNSRFVFAKTCEGEAMPLIKSLAASGIILALSTGVIYALVAWFKMPESIAPLPTLLITVPTNFLINKYWVFKIGGRYHA